MVLVYGITLAVSLILLGICLWVDKKRDIFLLLMFVFVCICNAGYLGLSLSRTLNTALFFNAMAYLGNVFLPFFVLMMVMELSECACPVWLKRVLIFFNCIVFAIVSSGGWLIIYYREVSLEIVDGTARLLKVYGPLHVLYKFFLIGYFAAMLAVIFVSAGKKKAGSAKQTTFLALVVLGNIALWLVENLTGTDFEFVTISYLMSEGLILMLYGIVHDHEAVAAPVMPEPAVEEKVPETRGKPLTRQQLQQLLTDWPAPGTLSQRELEVLRLILERHKRREIAEMMFVTESTIKKHTANIFKKLEVSNREELFRLAEEQYFA